MSKVLSGSIFDEVKQRIKCEYCEKTYAFPAGLRTHLESVHMQLVHRCPDCDATFTQRGHLRQHVRSIHEFVRYACEQCDYLATEKGHLKKHVRAVHEKLREYQCVLCHLMFSQRADLDRQPETRAVDVTDEAERQRGVVLQHRFEPVHRLFPFNPVDELQDDLQLGCHALLAAARGGWLADGPAGGHRGLQAHAVGGGPQRARRGAVPGVIWRAPLSGLHDRRDTRERPTMRRATTI